MANVTYYAVQPFERATQGRMSPQQPIVVTTGAEAVRKAQQLARERGGAIAFSRSGDDEWGDYDEPVILGQFGKVPGKFG